MLGPISIDPDSIADTMRRIAAGSSAVPSASSLDRAVGTRASVTKDFYDALEVTATTLSELVGVVLHELETTHEAIRKTVADLLEKDADNADEAAAILAMLDSTVTPEAAPPVAPVSPRTIAKDW